MAKLKNWYDNDACRPREDLREKRPMDASEFAVHLDHIRENRDNVSVDYLDPARFFDRTFLTGSLLDLSSQVVRRLSGIQVETSAVFNMATQFGGGKTHSLTTLYHLATSGEKAKSWKGVERILRKAEVPQVPKADVAVLVGTEFDVFQGRGGEGEPRRKTPWGEIAWQLGGEKGLAAVAEHDGKGIAPAGEALRAMLPAGPVLILMDELLNYVSRGRGIGLRDQLFNFLQNLSEESRARNNMVLCASIPASELEMNPDDQRDHDALKKLLDRLGKAIMMSAETEIAEIIRRRLFEWNGLNDDAKRTVRAYADWAIEHAPELSGVDPDRVYETFLACYPFHPSVLSVFERKWQSLPRFQRTRGVLRLLALWVSHAYQEEHRRALREPLITFGSAPLEDPQFRSALFEQLGSNELEVPVTTDIAGKKDAHAIRLDCEARDEIKKASLHRKVAATIFFESNGGMSQSKAEAALTEIRTAVASPDLNLVDVDNVLEGLVNTCHYLNWDRNRYRFGLTPNLNQILVTRRGAVKSKEIDEQVKKYTQDVFEAGPPRHEIDRKYFPVRSNDVPNRAVLTLVVMDVDHPAGEKETNQLLERIVRECGSSGRTFKSALLFAVPDAPDSIVEAARDLLAWEAIDEDAETKERLDEGQKRMLAKNVKRAKGDMKESIWRSYHYLYLLDKDNKLRQVDFGQITSSMAPSLIEVYLAELGRTDEVVVGVSPSRLITNWPSALTEWSTKGARDAFYSSPRLSRLRKPDAIKRTIADGVTQGVLGYATKDGSGQLKLLKFSESLSEAEVEISDDMFLLKAEDAQKLLEPPRLARLVIRPDHAVIRQGEQVSFTCSGDDQYGQPFDVGTVEWSATGGTVEGGLYTSTADGAAGLFTVRAEASGLEAIAEVRVTSPGQDDKDDDSHDDGKRRDGTIQWQGEVPPQKWMNFYTKVLSRFATTQGLKLKVSFEVPAEDDHGQAKAEEARSGLKELGLDDDVRVS